LVVPLALLLLLEGVLRLAGIGYETGFTRECEVGGTRSRCDNRAFSWQFFPRKIARTPVAFAFPERKARDTYRVFVVGGSAAQGDPSPQFGLARMIEVLLRERYPSVRLEVVNAAVTAINSHVVVPIARDLARYDGDLFVVYLGNNEVVGPFGAGTVFAPLSSSRALIRANLFLRGTRLGQVARGVFQSAGVGTGPEEWGGLEMFLGHRIRHDDPQMKTVYAHFKANLEAILGVASDSGADVIVSTVGTNLKDCAPFASNHDEGLGPDAIARFDDSLEKGRRREEAGALDAAVANYIDAEAIDESFAELQYRIGRLDLELGSHAESRRRLGAARDLDTLRFRADSRINDIIRSVVEARSGVTTSLTDAEALFEAMSPHGVPGAALFDDHVHLALAGNYALAVAMLPAIERSLAARMGIEPATGPPLSVQDCGARLAYTGFDRRLEAAELLRRNQRAPFTAQSSHDEATERLTRTLAELAFFATPEGLSFAAAQYREAIEVAPNDPWLRFDFGVLLTELGDSAGASEAFGEFVRHLPHDVPGREKLSSALAAGGRFADALAVCEELTAEIPEFTPPYYTRAYVLTQLGRFEDSLEIYRRLLKLDPEYAPTIWREMGKIYEHTGRTAEARDAFGRAGDPPG
jgi:tetratricopeptide (TPR) repeat protein